MLGGDINFLTGEDRRTDCLPNLIEGTSLQNIDLTYYDDFTLSSSSQRQWNSQSHASLGLMFLSYRMKKFTRLL